MSEVKQEINRHSLDTLCASLAYAMGIEAPQEAAAPSEALNQYVDECFGGSKADRIFMYNPDAIGEWITEKYASLMRVAEKWSDVKVPFCTVMPSVTPVCFGTMYTGAQPQVHGKKVYYDKTVIRIDTLFDALIRAGKKPAIVAQTGCSMAKLYVEREMDYFIYDSIEEVNAKAVQIILEDKYDFVAVYNGNYDGCMHQFGPESIEALAALRTNAETFALFSAMIKEHWSTHNTLVGFAMDHGCHELEEKNGPDIGSHGLDIPEDLNIVHLYKGYSAK